MARRATRRPPLKACLRCGALVYRDEEVCPVCGSTNFTEEWSGMIIILSDESLVARMTGKKRGQYAIKVAGRVVG